MSTQARQAINAAQHRRQWGRFATMRYLQKRGVQCDLYILAVNLESMKRAGL